MDIFSGIPGILQFCVETKSLIWQSRERHFTKDSNFNFISERLKTKKMTSAIKNPQNIQAWAPSLTYRLYLITNGLKCKVVWGKGWDICCTRSKMEHGAGRIRWKDHKEKSKPTKSPLSLIFSSWKTHKAFFKRRLISYNLYSIYCLIFSEMIS